MSIGFKQIIFHSSLDSPIYLPYNREKALPLPGGPENRPERSMEMISTRGRYAIRVMLDLAENDSGAFIPLKDVAARQMISKK